MAKNTRRTIKGELSATNIGHGKGLVVLQQHKVRGKDAYRVLLGAKDQPNWQVLATVVKGPGAKMDAWNAYRQAAGRETLAPNR